MQLNADIEFKIASQRPSNINNPKKQDIELLEQLTLNNHEGYFKQPRLKSYFINYLFTNKILFKSLLLTFTLKLMHQMIRVILKLKTLNLKNRVFKSNRNATFFLWFQRI